MTISLQITDSIKVIENNVNIAIATYINNIITRKQSQILNEVKALIPSWISSQPEIQSLKSNSIGSLVGQFGIQGDTQNIVNIICSSVANATQIKFVKYSNNLKGGLELYFQPSDFNNLLSLSVGHTVYSGGDLHWLDWLLKRGDSVIVTNYQYNPTTGLGRSGLGNMISGSIFRVPPEFSGTETNNFITRSFIGDAQESQITKILTKALSS